MHIKNLAARTHELIKTGQKAQYDGRPDDGFYEKGIDHDYETLTTGDQSGTTDIVINGKTHALSNNIVRDYAVKVDGKPLEWARYVPIADIGPAADGKLFWEQWTLAAESCTFNAAAKTITAAAGTPFNVSALCVGRKIDLTGTALNNIEVTVAAIANNVITTVENLINEGPVDTTFATKDDLIWDFLAQANANNLGGYSDWCLPNRKQFGTLLNQGRANPCIDTTVFPSTPSEDHWTSSTRSGATTHAFYVDFGPGSVSYANKQLSKYYVRLVR